MNLPRVRGRAHAPSGGTSPLAGGPVRPRPSRKRTNADRDKVIRGGAGAGIHRLAEEAVVQAVLPRRAPVSGARVTGNRTPGMHAGPAHTTALPYGHAFAGVAAGAPDGYVPIRAMPATAAPTRMTRGLAARPWGR